MKKFILGLFVLISLSLTTACSSDDDGGLAPGGQLTVTLDGQPVTFTSVIVDEDTYTGDDGEVYTELDVTATIGGDTTRIIEFGLESGDTGADAIYYFNYFVNGEQFYYNFNGFNTVVSVNNGSTLSMTFSGTLLGDYNPDTQQNNSITLENGSISVNY